MLRFGGPAGLQHLVEVATFALFLLLIGRLGESAMAATALAFTISNTGFLPLMGLGRAVTALVGQQQGRGEPGLAARATWRSLQMGLGWPVLMALLYLFAPDLLLVGHAAGAAPTEFAELRSQTAILLRFAAAYGLFDALNIVFVSALKGAGDTGFVWRASGALSLTLPLAAWASVEAGLGLHACWLAESALITSLGLTYAWRFRQGRWPCMRVIEPAVGSNRKEESGELLLCQT